MNKTRKVLEDQPYFHFVDTNNPKNHRYCWYWNYLHISSQYSLSGIVKRPQIIRKIIHWITQSFSLVRYTNWLHVVSIMHSLYFAMFQLWSGKNWEDSCVLNCTYTLPFLVLFFKLFQSLWNISDLIHIFLQGAGEAGHQVRSLQCFAAANTVKVNPDKPQEEVRFLALDVSMTAIFE